MNILVISTFTYRPIFFVVSNSFCVSLFGIYVFDNKLVSHSIPISPVFLDVAGGIF